MAGPCGASPLGTIEAVDEHWRASIRAIPETIPLDKAAQAIGELEDFLLVISSLPLHRPPRPSSPYLVTTHEGGESS